MKRAASVSSDHMEEVPNYWLRSLRDSDLLNSDRLNAALLRARLDPKDLEQPGALVPLA